MKLYLRSNVDYSLGILRKAGPGEESEGGSFRGGDPEEAADKRAQKQEELQESVNEPKACHVEKAGPGEESGSFRGGDPEEMADKRAQKRQEQEDSGELEEQKEEQERLLEEQGEEGLLEEEEEEGKSVRKAQVTPPAQVAPVNYLGDYAPRTVNGDLLSIQPQSRMPDINPTTDTRPGKNQRRAWSDVLKIPKLFQDDPVVQSRFLSVPGLTGKNREVAEEKLGRLLRSLNHGLTFYPELGKAKKGAIVPGHKYVYRWWEDNRWNYDYSEGNHANHGVGEIGNLQGHTVDVPESHKDPEGKDPQGAFQAALEDAKIRGGRFPFKSTNSETGEIEKHELRIPKAKFNKKSGKHEISDRFARVHKEGESKPYAKFSSFEYFEKQQLKDQVNTENDINGDPWVQWRVTDKGALFLRFLPGSKFFKDEASGFELPKGWIRASDKKIKNIDELRDFVEKEKKHQLSATKDTASSVDLTSDQLEMPVNDLAESGYFVKRQKPTLVPVKRVLKGKETAYAQYFNRINWQSSEEKEHFVGKLFKENEGLSVKIANDLLKRIAEKKSSQGKFAFTDKERKQLVRDLTVQSFFAAEKALESYDPKKSPSFSKHLSNYILKYQQMYFSSKSSESARQVGITHVSADDIFSNTGEGKSRMPKDLMDVLKVSQDVADNIEKTTYEPLDRWATRVSKDVNQWASQQEAKTGVPIDPNTVTERQQIAQEINNKLSEVVKNNDVDAAIDMYAVYNNEENGGSRGLISDVKSVNFDKVIKNVKRDVTDGVAVKRLNKEFGEGRLKEPPSILELSDPELKERLKKESHQNIKQFLISLIKNPLKTRRANAELTDALQWLKTDKAFVDLHGPTSSYVKKSLKEFYEFQASILLKAQQEDLEQQEPEQESPNVNYVGMMGDKEAPVFLYEDQVTGNIVRGTNAPETEEGHDPLKGSPVIHANEANPQDNPNLFSEDGKKLNRTAPLGNPTLEDNPNYNPDTDSGDFWVKRFKEDGVEDHTYVYNHSDLLNDQKLRSHLEIQHVDAQLPKIRVWYTTQMMSSDLEMQAVGLFMALVDQAKIPPSDILAKMKAGQFAWDGSTKALLNLVDMQPVHISFDKTPALIFKNLTDGKKPDEILFSIDDTGFDYGTFAQFIRDQFGISLGAFRSYQVTELYSKLFFEILKQKKHEFSLPGLEEVKGQALEKLADLLNLKSSVGLETFVDPVALEALYIAGYVYSSQAGMEKSAYKLQDRVDFRGLKISIENEKGSVRKWYDPHNDEKGSTKMQYPYGYIRMTEGVDGDHVDVYLGPDKEAKNVYVIRQMKAPDFKKIDEDKCMLGFGSASQAKEAYLAHYNDPKFYGSMTILPFEEFKDKVLATKDHPKLIKSDQKRPIWYIASNVTDRDEDENLFSHWLHYYPIHEHTIQWKSFMEQMQSSQDLHMKKKTGLHVQTARPSVGSYQPQSPLQQPLQREL